MGARHHARDDAPLHLGKSGLRLPAEVCRVARDAKLRQPVFLGMREDKDASQVTRER